ncbi:MAG: NUDIX hydrolase [Candidatus Aenigmarchaeota archaeon]|nr:NUDIX hydrolase [Candidatus Aenigmarchaeota archaeon]
MTEQKFHVGVKALILNDKNEILILRANPSELRRQATHWDLPGGRIKENDSIEETLRKEINEELGVDNIKIVEHFDTSISNIKIPLDDETVGLILIVYKCKLPDNNVDLKLSFEHLEYKWASVDEAKELLKFKFGNSFIEKLDLL